MSVTDLRRYPQFMDRQDRPWKEWVLRWVDAAANQLRAQLRVALGGQPCPVCGSENLEHLVIGDRPYMLSCQRCNLIFLGTRPTNDELRRYYATSDRVTGPSPRNPGLDKYFQHRNNCYRSVGLKAHEDRLGRARRALDVGCGAGLNLDVLAGRGWQVEGIDPSPAQIAAVRERGFEGAVADLDQAAVDPGRAGRYHLVTMFHVVEHLSEPLRSLCRLAAVVAPGGLLVLETPLSCDLTNRDHLMFFSGASIHILLERAGFCWQGYFMYVAHAAAHDNLVVLARKTDA
jgi:2-polyprenyl-3-methyl-5-hydroxy-6-metoxy-1,4-benzoquinol methylase